MVRGQVRGALLSLPMPSMAVTPTTLHSRQSSLASPPGCGGAPLGCDMIVGCSIGPAVELCTGAAERPLWRCPRQHVQSTLQGAQIQPCHPPHELADAQQERVGVLSGRPGLRGLRGGNSNPGLRALPKLSTRAWRPAVLAVLGDQLGDW
jgi:hypothetical protein